MHIAGKGFATLGLASVIAALMIATPSRTGWADDFADKCVAAGGGMFEAKDCACMKGKIASDEDRDNLVAFFEANIEANKNGTKPDENDPQLQKGFALMNDTLGKCMK